jgi:hypothetical protein
MIMRLENANSLRIGLEPRFSNVYTFTKQLSCQRLLVGIL